MNPYLFNPLTCVLQRTLHLIDLLLHLDQPCVICCGPCLTLKIILIELMLYEVILFPGQILLSC